MLNLDLREIPALYINLGHHVEKNLNMQNLLRKCGFKRFARIEGIARPDNPVAGCSSAHHKALSALEPPFILLEDDCIINNFRPIIQVPSDADAVYLGISSWGRMNGHSGPCVQFKRVKDDLIRVYNMLGGHAILYLSKDYTAMCRRISYHAGYIIQSYQDIGFAEIQRYFNVYTFDDPLFYQTSSYHGTSKPLTSYPVKEYMKYDGFHYLPSKIM